MKNKILIIGTGAIGSFYGSRLAKAGADVCVVVRSGFEKVQKNGILIKSFEGDFHFQPNRVIKDVAEYQDEADFIIIATKALLSVDVATLVKPVVEFGNNKTNASLVLIQNGIHIEAPLRKSYPDQHLISCIAFIAVSKIASDIVNHQGFGRIVIGDYPDGISKKTKILADLFTKSQTQCLLTENIKLDRWKKLVWNIGFNPTSVFTGGLDTIQMLSNPEIKSLILNLMQEVKILAKADGCDLPENVIQKNIDDTLKMPPYKTSMLLDFEAKREMEIEAILGNALRFAKLMKINVPNIENSYKKMCNL